MPLRHHQPPSDARMIGDISRRVAVLEREKNPVAAAVASSGSLSGRITAESTLWAYWPLTDVSGNAVDTVAGRDLTPTTSGLFPKYGQPGPFTETTDTSIEFSGTNGFSGAGSYFHRATLSAESAAVFASGHAFTVELLVYQVGVQAGGMFVYAVNSAASHRLAIDGNNKVEFMRSGTDFVTGPVLPTQTWTHVAGTYDGTTMLLYVNGGLAGSVASSTPGATGGQDVNLGMYGNGPFSFLKGRLAQVAVYTTALPAATIAQHANAGIANTSTGARINTVTAAYTITDADGVILANGTFTVTLPTAAGKAGRIYKVKNTGVGTITVGRTGTETIDGTAANITMATSKQEREFTSDGAGWQITGAYL